MTEQQQQVTGGAIDPTITAIPELGITASHHFIVNRKEEEAISTLDRTTLALAYGVSGFTGKTSFDEIKPRVGGALSDTYSSAVLGDGVNMADKSDSFMRDAHAFCACKTILSVNRDQNQNSDGELGSRHNSHSYLIHPIIFDYRTCN